MHTLMSVVYPILLVLTISAGSVLAQHLGAGSVPPRLQPLTNAWVKAGGDPKRVKLFLWLLFSLLACAFFAAVIMLAYPAVADLGRGFK